MSRGYFIVYLYWKNDLFMNMQSDFIVSMRQEKSRFVAYLRRLFDS